MKIGAPTIFISSTVFDFRDLRSALKYWLEELGYHVLLFEYNDFPKALDKNSYDACVATVERADYFILLVGGRDRPGRRIWWETPVAPDAVLCRGMAHVGRPVSESGDGTNSRPDIRLDRM